MLVKSEVGVKVSMHSSVFSSRNKLMRILWAVVYYVFFRFSPTPMFKYRRWLLTIFGAQLGDSVYIYPSVKIWWPGNFSLGEGSSLGPRVNVYNQGSINIGSYTIVSQGAHLCASTHDYNNSLHPLVLAPIQIGHHVWICAEAFIGPHVSIADGCVMGARAVVSQSTQKWGVYAGNPAVFLKTRARVDAQ